MSDTWTTIWSSLAAAVIGGILSAGAGFLATRQAHRYNRELEEAKRRKAVNGILLAIRNEISCVADGFKASVGDRLENLKDDEPFATVFKMDNRYLIVYPNNTDIVGQVDDAELCMKIIQTYQRGAVLMEVLATNSWACETFLETKTKVYQSDSPAMREEFELQRKHLVAHVSRIRARYSEFVSAAKELLPKIEQYLAS